MTTTQVLVGLGEIKCLQGEGHLVCLGIGSCVGLILMDVGAKIGTMAHIMMPSDAEGPNPDRPAKFANEGVPAAIELIERLGANRANLQAALIGGAQVLRGTVTSTMIEFGARNVHAVKQHLQTNGITCVASDTGGTRGRSAVLDLKTGTLISRSPGGSEHLVCQFALPEAS